MVKSFVMRHGQASNQADKDFDRPLTASGQAQVQAQAHYFKRQWQALPVIYVSPLVRAQQTAHSVARQCAVAQDRIKTVDWLRPETPVELVLNQLLSAQEDILLVSHQPLVSTLTAALSGQSPWSLAMSPASVAVLEGDICVANGMLLERIYDAG